MIPDFVTYNGVNYPVTSISDWAFWCCSGLTGSLTIPNSVTTIGKKAFQACHHLTGTLTLGNSVTFIGDEAFYNCDGLTGSLTIPNSVTSIGNFAFYNCDGLTGSLTIPNSVTTIGSSAFCACSGLTGTLTIGNSVTTIGSSAFEGCKGLTGNLTIPNSVTTIGSSAFWNCSGLTGSLTIGNSVKTIGSSAFYGCSGLTGSLTIGNSVTIIDDYAFMGCEGLTGSLTIGNSVATIGNKAFFNCKGLTGSLTIPNSVIDIDINAFFNCKGLTGPLIIGNSVSKIGAGVFSGCDGLTDIYLPASLKSVGYQAFYFNAKSVTCEALNPPTITFPEDWENYTKAFTPSTKNNAPLIVPNESLEAYKTAYEWRDFKYIIGSQGVEMEARVSATKVREGSRVTYSAEAEGDTQGWTYEWSRGNEVVSTELTFEMEMTMAAAGNEQATETAGMKLTAAYVGDNGQQWATVEEDAPAVTIYRRPLTPAQLLRKGDGSSKTLIAMMSMTDSELAKRGYSYVYGYTDRNGTDHIVARTDKRYCRLDARVFDDASASKWCYSEWSYADGSVVTSGKRYLDGTADEDFNGSQFGGQAMVGTTDYSHSDNWIRVDDGVVSVTVDNESATRIMVHTVSGAMVRMTEVPAATFGTVAVDSATLAPGIYVVTVESGDVRVSKKVIIR